MTLDQILEPQDPITELLELCINEGHYPVMAITLKRAEPTYHKFEHYKAKLKDQAPAVYEAYFKEGIK